MNDFEIMNKLHHPNLNPVKMRIHNMVSSTTKQMVVIESEYREEGSLQTYLETREPLDE